MFWFLIFFFLFRTSAFAVDEFSLKQNIVYNVNQNGQGQVTQDLELNNNISQIYPTSYQLQLSGQTIENVTGTDNQGNIIEAVTQNNDEYNIKLKFNEQNVGKDKKTNFTIRYNIPKLAQQKGKVWEITLPQYQLSSAGETNIVLKIPNIFGKLSFSSIPRPQITNLGNYSEIKITPKNLQKIMFIFGQYQLFDFTLQYELNNTSSDYVKTTIPLPPENESQIIVYQSIDPQPNSISVDADGNHLAEYFLDPNQIINVTAIGQAKIIGNNIKTTLTDTSLFTKEDELWPISDPSIKTIAATLSTPQDIYNYVVNTLSYNYDGISTAKRQGALNALLEPTKAVCTEFTDLFVTLARAKGIPAREVEGFAYTNNTKLKPTNINGDILHAWPQYYNTKTQEWISIDPTWGKTTNGIDYFHELDLNHFALVYHGLNSSSPSTAGSYKSDKNQKTVDIKFASTEIENTTLPLNMTSDRNYIYIKNPNNHSLQNLNLNSTNIPWNQNITVIPAFSSQQFPLPKINFFLSLLPKNQKIYIDLISNDNNQTAKYQIKYPLHFQNLLLTIIVSLTLLAILGIIITKHEKTA